MGPKWRRTKAQVEKDKAPEWRRVKAQVEKDEGPEAETLSRLLIFLSGFLVEPISDLSSFTGSGVYPDLSSFTGSGVYPDLSSFIGSGVYPDLSSFTGSGVYPDLSSFTGSGVIQKLYSLYQVIRPVRFTSSGIRASALDTEASEVRKVLPAHEPLNLQPKWRRTKAQVEKDKAPEWRRVKAQVEKDEGPEAETLSRLLITYQGNPCGVYPDLSSFTGSGVYPDLSSFTGSGVYPDLSSFTGSGVIQKLYSLYQVIRPVRFTSWYMHEHN
ncbi:hypothetical protein HKD37_11G031393 [Glycine soja]